MNVLVVDDLYQVVQGMLEGVAWDKMGIENVYAAYSVDGARSILREHPVQLLLCDIEMPPHNGFELLEWIREQRMETECIFLSSHAEFEYARTAVTMGSFDYILQPARYEDIEAAVCRAIARIEEKQRAQDAARYGRYWQENQKALLDACVLRFLQSRGDGLDRLLADFKRLDISIGRSTEVCLVLMQLNGKPGAEDARQALNRLFGELLRRTDRTLCIARVQPELFLVLLFGGDMRWAEIVEPLRQLTERWEQSGLGEKPACYVSGGVLPDELYAQYDLLRQRWQDNVAGYGGVFAAAQTEEILHYVYTFPDMRRWSRQLLAGEGAQVREEALSYLAQQRADGKLTSEFLARFHQDFIQMFFSTLQQRDVNSHELFTPEYPFTEFMHAYASYERMTAMVRFAIRAAQGKPDAQQAAESPVELAVRYIQRNIEKDLHRGDVADAIYLNADYLSRLFKKEKGISLSDFIVSEKMRVAASLLRSTAIPVSIIASKVGYSNFSYFSQVFKRTMGSAPVEYRQAARE